MKRNYSLVLTLLFSLFALSAFSASLNELFNSGSVADTNASPELSRLIYIQGPIKANDIIVSDGAGNMVSSGVAPTNLVGVINAYTKPEMDGIISTTSNALKNAASSDLAATSNAITASVSSGYLSKTNTTAFTPTELYNPATKKYVDDNAGVSVSAKVFGAVGDGITDDTSAIQAAIDSLRTAVASESVTLPTWTAFHLMDSVGTWTGGNGGTVSSVAGFRGNAVKLTSSTTSEPYMSDTFSATDISSYNYIQLTIKGKLKIRVMLEDSSGDKRYYVFRTESLGEEWEHYRIRLDEYYTGNSNADPAADLTDIVKIEICDMVITPPSGRELYVDEIGFVAGQAFLANRFIHPELNTISGAVDGTDYFIEKESGEVRPLIGGALSSGSTVSVAYTHGAGKVVVPDGVYKVTSSIRLFSWVDLNIVNGAQIVYTGTDAAIRNDDTHFITDFSLTGGGIIDGQRAAYSLYSKQVDGVRITKADNVILRDFEVRNFNGYGVQVLGLDSNKVTDLNIDGLTVDTCGTEYMDDYGEQYGVIGGYKQSFVVDNVYNGHVQDVEVLNARTDATLFTKCDTLVIEGMRIRRCRMGGFYVFRGINITATDGMVDSAGSRGCTIENVTNMVYTGWTVKDSGREACWINPGYGGYLGISGLVVSDNIFARGSYAPADQAGGDREFVVRINGDSVLNTVFSHNVVEAGDHNINGISVQLCPDIVLDNNIFLNCAKEVIDIANNPRSFVRKYPADNGSFLNGNFTVTTNVLTDVDFAGAGPSLSVKVKAGDVYSVEGLIEINQPLTTVGYTLAFAGPSSKWASYMTCVYAKNNDLYTGVHTVLPGTALNLAPDTPTLRYIKFFGFYSPSVDGDFTVQIAQNTYDSGTSVKAGVGSYLRLDRIQSSYD